MVTIGTRSNRLRGLFAASIVVSLLVPAVVEIAPARAATETFSESFSGATLSSPSDWIASRSSTSRDACLTALAEGSSIALSSGQLVGCPGAGAGVALDAGRPGVLRLTDAAVGQSAMVLYREPQKMSDGLDITFSFAMHSGIADFGTGGADGFSVFIKDGSNSTDRAGVGGGALGYALSASKAGVLQQVNGVDQTGVPGGLLAVGFDFFGNFSLPQQSCHAGGDWQPGLRSRGASRSGHQPGQRRIVRLRLSRTLDRAGRLRSSDCWRGNRPCSPESDRRVPPSTCHHRQAR